MQVSFEFVETGSRGYDDLVDAVLPCASAEVAAAEAATRLVLRSGGSGGSGGGSDNASSFAILRLEAPDDSELLLDPTTVTVTVACNASRGTIHLFEVSRWAGPLGEGRMWRCGHDVQSRSSSRPTATKLMQIATVIYEPHQPTDQPTDRPLN